MCSKRSAEWSRAMNRRDFLRLGGAGLAGAALLAAIDPSKALADPDGAPLAKEFGVASAEYGVPEELLLAVGYVNTRWEMPSPALGAYEPGNLHGMGGYGIMRLRRDPS